MIRRERGKERQRVRNYEWTGSALRLAVLGALLRALSRGCCSPTADTGSFIPALYMKTYHLVHFKQWRGKKPWKSFFSTT
ncbi:hypothetical protein EYF80_007457 [Liparis tanakae]|uniref:Uncharacterized protein n=1 Tax=Liparis tanakae TaxID=230148 RepID=A0A4Z2IWT8_9TELE|nr:hypothetical protein EYF80_007457 [Liparis tanakae]